jgi:arylsulfatase A-like enzyme
MAPAPYNDMYGPQHVIAPNRSEGERVNPHPVYAAFMRHEESINFSRDEVRSTVIPTYMGLIKQIDDQLGRLWEFLGARDLFDKTMIVVTSDHGDYLGDHWLGEKELFHEESARVPLIVYDPDPAANATRGGVDHRLVEAIDLVPTFVEAAGGRPPYHVLEGSSLLGALRPGQGGESARRNAVFSECDYAFRAARIELGVSPSDARAYMVRTERWKYVFYERFRPQLFDLENDPRELRDLGDDAGTEAVRREHADLLFAWARHRRSRVTVSDAEIERRTNTHKRRGIIFGEW